MGEYEYHANPIDWHKPSMAAGKGKKAGESAVFKPPLAGRVGSLFNKIEVRNPETLLCYRHIESCFCAHSGQALLQLGLPVSQPAEHYQTPHCFAGHATDRGQCCVMSCINHQLILAGHVMQCCEDLCMGAFCSFFKIDVSTWCSVKL